MTTPPSAANPAPVDPAAAATARPPAKPRIAVWDNARFLLIVLVVIGHAISTVRTDSQLGFALYAYIYLFHMPAMILLSGLFSRPETTPKAIRSTIQLIVIWLTWEAIWAVIHFAVEGETPGQNFLVSPAWTLWFLVTLATMRILLPYVAMLRRPLLFSIAVALGSSILPAIGTPFSASRTLAFLPFFVAGWLIRDRGWLDGQWFVRPSRKALTAAWIGIAALAAGFALSPGLRGFWRIDKWLTWRDDYAWLFRHAPIGDWAPSQWIWTTLGGIAVAAVLMAVAAALTLALLIVTPRGQSAMTAWGSRTLFVYLLHGPIIWVLRETGAIEWANGLGWPGLLGIAAFAIALAVLLSLAWVPKAFGPIVEPRFDWVLRRS
ncbi:MAG: acyltransferase family protein [Leucobacter sp.]